MDFQMGTITDLLMGSKKDVMKATTTDSNVEVKQDMMKDSKMDLTGKLKAVLIAWIWLVTAADIWCCQWLTVEAELNPLARFLFSNSDIWTLISCKVFGTYLATEWLRRLPFYFTVIISLCMLVLLLILTGIL